MTNQKTSDNSSPAYWITDQNAEGKSYGVYHFRKQFNLLSTPDSFIIHVSADNRYRLFVNDQPVCSGPPSSSPANWFFETVDISTFLNKGSNTIAAVVWNMGEYSAIYQMSVQTAFFIQGEGIAEKAVNSNSTWKVMINNAYTPCSKHTQERINAYFVVGPGDCVDAALYPWSWEKQDFDDQSWNRPILISEPIITRRETNNKWQLTPRNIPMLRESKLRILSVRRTTIPLKNVDFLKGTTPLEIPPNHQVSLLMDNAFNIVAHPELILSGGQGSSVELVYAESLFDSNSRKGNRNEIKNKDIFGNYDQFLTDGGLNRKFRTLSIRTYRYIQLNITTHDEPLIINDIYGMYTGYPLKVTSSFTCDDASLHHIWNVGLHTIFLCSGESFYDTPYYEQLQYTGDSRIQALITYYISNDDRLVKKAILDFSHSFIEDGLTQSRYPSHKQQIIPAFSLFWISMVYDYWMHRQDDTFVRQFLSAIKKIMNWFRGKIDYEVKILGPLPYWNFVDWNNFDELGRAPGADKGNSAIVSLQYSYTLLQAAELCNAFADPLSAKDYRLLSESVNEHTFSSCYNLEKGLIADTPEQISYSQHAGIWALLSGAVPNYAISAFTNKLLQDKSIGQVTYFYHFYLVQALKKAGMADMYLELLAPWKEMVNLGMTTFAEKPEPTRSDCHAWSASPVYDFLFTICGIIPSRPGFKQVTIKPALGNLTHAEGVIAHPFGELSVILNRIGKDGIKAAITLPHNLDGIFIWKGHAVSLVAGQQIINIEPSF